MLIKTLRSAYSLLDYKHRKKGLFVSILMVIQSGLDVLSLAIFFPVLTIIIDPAIIQSNSVMKAIYSSFSFSSHAAFVLTFTSFILLFIVIKNLVSLWITRVKARYVFSIGTNLASRTLDNYLQMRFLDFAQVDFAKEMNRIAGHPISFANSIILPATVLMSEGLVVVLVVGCIAWFNPLIVILLAVILIPAILVFQFRKKKLTEISHSLKEKFPLLLKHTQQAVEAFSEIRIHLKESFFKRRFEATSREVGETFVKEHTIQGGTIRLTEVMVAVVICFLIFYSVLMDIPSEKTLLLLGLYAGASFRLVPSMNRIILSLQQIRSNEYLPDELNIRESNSTDDNDIDGKLVFNESLKFDNVSFSYPGRAIVLDNISLRISKGEKIAITGNSGEGKTTLLLILLRLLKETSGQLLLDNNRVINDRAWTRLIAYVPQNPYVLDATLAENIAFGLASEHIDQSKITRLVSDLDLTDLIQQLPEGIDTRIGERGIKLSGGQRQRIALARALYLDAEILILDEVTNQVHESLESDILKLLGAMKKMNKTIIMVTHKISDTNFFDSIYSLEKGRLQKNTVVSPR